MERDCRLFGFSSTSREFRNNFTLIELLVFIAIIAILIALLLPSLKKAKDSAESIVCKSNLRQIGLSCMNYASDWVGVLPHSSWTTNYTWGYYQTAYSGYWYRKLDLIKEGATNDPNNYPEVYKCLTAQKIVSPRAKSSPDRYLLDYGLAYNIDRSKANYSGSGDYISQGPLPNLHSIARTSFLLADGRMSWYDATPASNSGFYAFQYVKLPASSTTLNTPPWPMIASGSGLTGGGYKIYGGHIGKTSNLVFIDLHAESMTIFQSYDLYNKYSQVPAPGSNDRWEYHLHGRMP